MTKLLSDRIKDLHLRPNAPYPSEAQSAHEMILEWRRTQRLHSITEDNPQDEPEDDDDGPLAA